MKKITLLLVLLLSFLWAKSQGEGSVFTSTGRGVSTTFATDYQALGINPANLGWSKEFKGKTLALGFFETGFSLETSLINNSAVKEIRALPLNFSIDNAKSYSDFTELSSDLQKGIKLNVDTRLVGFALTTKRFGGFGFSVTERYSMQMNLGKDFADIVTFGFGAPYFDSLVINQGGSISKIKNTPSNFDSLQRDTSLSIIAGTSSDPKSIPGIFEGTQFKVSWIREFNFGYGVKLIKTKRFGIYAGIGVKYLQGMAILDFEASANQLNGFLSHSNSIFSLNNPGLFSVGNFKFKLPKAAGKGFGVDLGLNIKLFKRIKIGFAVNDLGSITWTQNTYNIQSDSALSNFKAAGFYNDSSLQSPSGGATFDSILNSLVQLEKGNFERTIALPARYRIGASIQFGKFLQIGGEIISPLNTKPGNFESSIYSVGGDLKLGPLIFSGGMVFQNNRERRIPFGVVISPMSGRYELGISTRDIQSLIKFHDVENPMYSTAFGFLRFRI